MHSLSFSDTAFKPDRVSAINILCGSYLEFSLHLYVKMSLHLYIEFTFIHRVDFTFILRVYIYT